MKSPHILKCQSLVMYLKKKSETKMNEHFFHLYVTFNLYNSIGGKKWIFFF